MQYMQLEWYAHQCQGSQSYAVLRIRRYMSAYFMLLYIITVYARLMHSAYTHMQMYIVRGCNAKRFIWRSALLPLCLNHNSSTCNDDKASQETLKCKSQYESHLICLNQQERSTQCYGSTKMLLHALNGLRKNIRLISSMYTYV
jgi:hypothetical protein